MSSPAGSSPLTRGKRVVVHGQVAREGLIPAHAGKTELRSALACASAAHPRSRGENERYLRREFRRRGSSPLTRGKHGGELGVGRGRGLIPAHAGKTYARSASRASVRAHPRSRGENLGDDALSATPTGSSPLTRGKPDRLQRREQGPGLIPAHAGKTRAGGRPGVRRPAHPRSRGENRGRGGLRGGLRGSSPLTRGKLVAVDAAFFHVRLIPAHAGKTRTRSERGRRSRAHPRSRGENAIHLMPQPTVPGSSPLTRGKPS